MEILFLRHGRTKGNTQGRYVGRTDEPLLNEEYEILQKEGARYAEGGTDAFVPDLLFVSPMKRAVETAQAVFPKKEQILCDDLRETDFGAFEYKNYEELNGDPAYQVWIDSAGCAPFPDGEPGQVFRERCIRAFLACYQKAAEAGAKKAAVVAHGGTIMAIIGALHPDGGYYEWQLKNGCAYKTEFDGKQLVILQKITREN